MFDRPIDRRALLKNGAAVSAAALSSPVWATEAAPALRPERFVVDRRFAPAVACGRAADTIGLRVAGVAGDLSALWFDDLDLAWRRRPMALAGVTGPDGLFVLETLANDRGMRVVYRGVHELDSGVGAHELRGPGGVVTPLADILERRGFDTDAIVGAVARFPAGKAPVRTIRSGGRSVTNPAGPGAIVSWVIAPRGLATPAV